MAPKTKTAKKQELLSIKSQPKAPVEVPDWPPITTLVPAADLSFVPLLPDHILTVPQLWTTSLCRSYVSFLSTLTMATTPGKPKRGEAVRFNDRFQVDDAHFAEKLWTGTALKEMVGQPSVDGRSLDDTERRALWGGDVLGLNSNIRVYRYTKGQFFDQHYDESNNVLFSSTTSPSPIPAKTTWTLLLYLSSPATGCKGGETVFYPDPPSKREAAPSPVVAELEVGMALLHRHGKDCLLHEGRQVTEGEKWIIRSDLCVRR